MESSAGVSPASTSLATSARRSARSFAGSAATKLIEATTRRCPPGRRVGRWSPAPPAGWSIRRPSTPRPARAARRSRDARGASPQRACRGRVPTRPRSSREPSRGPRARRRVAAHGGSRPAPEPDRTNETRRRLSRPRRRRPEAGSPRRRRPAPAPRRWRRPASGASPPAARRRSRRGPPPPAPGSASRCRRPGQARGCRGPAQALPPVPRRPPAHTRVARARTHRRPRRTARREGEGPPAQRTNGKRAGPLGAQDPANARIALVDHDVLLAAARVKQILPHATWELSSALHPAAAPLVSPVLVLLRGLLVGEQLVLGVRLAGVAGLAAVGRLSRRAAVVVLAVRGQLVHALAVPPPVGRGPGREPEGGCQRARRDSRTGQEAAARRGTLCQLTYPLNPAARPAEPLTHSICGYKPPEICTNGFAGRALPVTSRLGDPPIARRRCQGSLSCHHGWLHRCT